MKSDFDGGEAQGNKALLHGIAEHEKVGGDRIAQQRCREAGAVDEIDAILAGRVTPDGIAPNCVAQGALHAGGLEIDIAVEDERGSRRQCRVDDGARYAVLDARQRRRARRHHHVAAEDEPRAAGGDAHGVDVLGLGRQADMAHHRAVLLREAGEVEDGAALAFEMRRHAEEGADGDDAGAADAGDEDAIGLGERGGGGQGKRGEGIGVDGSDLARRLARAAAMDGDEARAEALEAGEILVAIGLVDGALAAELGLERLDRDAV